jgi:hypothetical protein
VDGAGGRPQMDGPRRTGQPSTSVGRPWRTAPAAGGRPWDRRTRPDVRWTRPWTSRRVTTLTKPPQIDSFAMFGEPRGSSFGSSDSICIRTQLWLGHGYAESMFGISKNRDVTLPVCPIDPTNTRICTRNGRSLTLQKADTTI